MPQLNPRYEAIFNPDNIELKASIKWEESEASFDSPEREQARPKVNCDRIASLMNVEADFIKEALDAELYKQAVTMYLQLLKAADKQEESQVTICAFPSVSEVNEVKYDIDAESQALLEDSHKEILQSEYYQEYGYPSYIER